MKRILIILSILVVFVMFAVQIGNVSANSEPLQPLGGWIWWLFPESESIYVIGYEKIAYPKIPPHHFGAYIYVTPETQINIGDVPGDFGDLEEGQYITFEYYEDDGQFYATWITVEPGGRLFCPPGQDPCIQDPFP